MGKVRIEEDISTRRLSARVRLDTLPVRQVRRDIRRAQGLRVDCRVGVAPAGLEVSMTSP